MADYSEEIADAVEAIEEAGGSFTFERSEQFIDDPDKPWIKTPGRVPDSYTAIALMLEFRKTQQSQGFTAGSEDAKAILPGDMIVYLAAGSVAAADQGFKPLPRDIVVTPQGERYGVVDNITLAPNGQEILYKLWVRK